MDRIIHNGKLVAVHVRRFPEKTTPVCAPTEALQLILMNRPKGDIAKAHRHLPKKRITNMLQECLIVMKGRIRYDLFDARKRCFKKIIVKEGEAMFISAVGHAVHFLEDSLVYELKNGPFIDDKEWL